MLHCVSFKTVETWAEQYTNHNAAKSKHIIVIIGALINSMRNGFDVAMVEHVEEEETAPKQADPCILIKILSINYITASQRI